MKKEKEPAKVSRREILKLTLATGVGVAIGATGIDRIASATKQVMKPSKKESVSAKDKGIVPFFGEHQSGIITPQQKFCYLASFRLLTAQRQEVINLFQNWTKLSDAMTQGTNDSAYQNDWLPPKDTGEALELSISHLTITFGLGPTFFELNGKDRYGLVNQKPKELMSIPAYPRDNIQEPFRDGDLAIQVCANDQQVAFHAIRNLIKSSIGKAELKWMQAGFVSGADGKTPRNLFGFKDGTGNIGNQDTKAQQAIVWAKDGEPTWFQGGTYLAFRRIRMFLEVWDRSSLKDQEDTFGRKKESGAPYGKRQEHDPVNTIQLPPTSHVALARNTGQQIYRRGYSFTDGVDPRTGNVEAGLAFISFQKSPQQQLFPMLKVMAEQDTLNEYIQHVGTGIFACPRGIRKGEYVAQALLEG